MKRVTTLSILLLLAFGPHAKAQLAKQKDLKPEQVYARVNSLLDSKDPAAKDSVRWEASHLLASSVEEYMQHARSIYSYLGDKEASEEAQQSIMKKFPKGSYAAGIALDKVLADYMEPNSFAKSFQQWTKTYQKTLTVGSFAESSYAKVAAKLLKSGEIAAAEQYAAKLTNPTRLVDFQLSLAQDAFDKKDYTLTAQLLEKVLKDHATLIKENKNLERRTYMLYTQVLAEQQQWSAVLENIDTYGLNLTDLKFQALAHGSADFQAFLFLENHFSNSSLTAVMEVEGPALFERLGATREQWTAYKDRVETKKLKDKQQAWKSSMIDEDSHDFDLVDMQGKPVKSSDYKGKIVVLDFWATWCGPCINSFPGMQAAVNQYKADKDVVFLFINTWEQGGDYKEKVPAFIASKGYDFHVVYDHMDGDNALVGKYGIKGIPTKIFIDKKGRVRFQSSGSSPVVKEIQEEIAYKIELIKALDKE